MARGGGGGRRELRPAQLGSCMGLNPAEAGRDLSSPGAQGMWGAPWVLAPGGTCSNLHSPGLAKMD